MSKFLNKKEQVIDFQLTRHGRRKLAAGKLKPTFYAFYDDGVIYDSEFAGFAENQNNVHSRIKSDTSFIETPSGFEEVETSVPPGNYLELAYEDVTSMSAFDFDISPDKNILQTNKFCFDSSIGDAAFEGENTQAAPAWKVVTCQGEILSASLRDTAKYDFTHVELDKEAREFNIPQLEVGLYYTKLIDKPTSPFGHSTVADSVSETAPFADGYSIRLIKDDLVVYADEVNTELFTENFDIEVFRVNEEEGEQKLATTTIEILDMSSNEMFGGVGNTDDGGPVTITINDGENSVTFELVADGFDPATDGNVGVTIPINFQYLGQSRDNEVSWGLMYNLIAAIDDAFDNNYPTIWHQGSNADGSVITSGAGRCTNDELHHPKCVVNSGNNTLNVSATPVPPPAITDIRRIVTLTNLNLGKEGTITTNFSSKIKVKDFSGAVRHKTTELERKFFEKQIPQIIDGLMVSNNPKQNLNTELNTDAVEYYFDVLTDTSVDAKIACECAASFNKNSYYIDIDFDPDKCKEAEEEVSLYLDLYGSVTVPEICDPDLISDDAAVECADEE